MIGGPWPSVSVCYEVSPGSSGPDPEPPTWLPICKLVGSPKDEANAALIVEAVNNYFRLVDENAALRKALEEIRAELDDYSDVIDNPEGGSPRPNIAMRLLQFLDEKLAAIKERGE